MKGHNAVFIGQDRFIFALKVFSFSRSSRSFLGQVIDTQNHILGRNGHRTAVGRL